LAIVGLGANWYSVIVAAVVASLAMGSLEGGVNGLALDLNRAAQGANLSKVHIFAALGALIGPLFIGQALTMGVSWPWMIACTSVGALMLLAWMLRLPIPDGKHRPASKESVQRSVSNYERRLVPFLALALAINLSVAIEMAVSNWVVRLLSSVSLQQATFVLSLFWTGLLCGRIVSMRLSGRLSSEALLTICGLGATASLAFALRVRFVLPSWMFHWSPLPTHYG
jgi:MFS transporter, FHS family, glucose/mannose:H+ symporter